MASLAAGHKPGLGWFDRALLWLQGLLLASAVLTLAWTGYQAWRNPFVETLVERSAEELREAVWLQVARRIDAPELERRLQVALAQDPIAWTEIDLNLKLAERLKLSPEPATLTDITQQRREARQPLAMLGACWQGLFALEVGHSVTEASCAGLSEVTSIGDVKSLLRAGAAYASGQPIDRFDLSLGVAGLVLTGATLVSAGSAAPAKVSVATLKVAKRARVLSPGLQRVLQRRLARSIKLDEALQGLSKELGRGVFASGASLQSRALRLIERSVDPKAFQRLADDLADLGVSLQRVGPKAALYTLRFVGSGQDIARLKRFSAALGKETPEVLSVLGRGGYRLLVKTSRSGLRLAKLVGLLAWQVLALALSLGLSLGKLLVSGLIKRARRRRAAML